eukprot:CAMPEP_0118927678 /NCGR_PEP_ID=MMETSP1169-20130426/5098_1 /TAXON_ID=36882 /ORGANISM="Pyramimonas obovata, Strain CCMP722" /LENGTH=383 /DNA_ID=CAMNT_0006869497 /DNA_START=344 /DNA_END=1495 /DNA_ORIENTATION=-
MSVLGAWMRIGSVARAEGCGQSARIVTAELTRRASGGASGKGSPLRHGSRNIFRPMTKPAPLTVRQPMKYGSALVFSTTWGASLSPVPVLLGPNQYLVGISSNEGVIQGDWPIVTAVEQGARAMTTTTTKEESVDEVEQKSILLNSGAASIPHPDKKEKGGEDSYFVAAGGKWIGVADGVGGWAELGVDAGEYARTLMRLSAQEAEQPENEEDPLKVLEKAFQNTFVQGSCTACILTVQDSNLRAANIGDSGFVVVRKGKVLFRSQPQQHDFNFPYQLGGDGSDKPRDAQCYQIRVQSGDAVVVGTDGLFDNVHDRDVALIASRAVKQGLPPAACATQLASLATALAQDGNLVSPFAKAAREAGYAYRGGKADDTTVVVSYVE